MTRGELKTELRGILQDPTTNSSLDDWLAQERLAIAAEYELPSLKLDQPVSGTTTTSNWLYELPPTYHKKVFKARNSHPHGEFLPIYRDIRTIDAMDFDHDETGTYVQQIAVEGDHFAIHPKANDTLYLWFWRLPDLFVDDDDSPDELPEAFHHKVLVPRVVLRAFRVYPELARSTFGENAKALDLWRTRLREGLYGSPHTGEIGMMQFFTKSKPPRRHGGRNPLP